MSIIIMGSIILAFIGLLLIYTTFANEKTSPMKWQVGDNQLNLNISQTSENYSSKTIWIMRIVGIIMVIQIVIVFILFKGQ